MLKLGERAVWMKHRWAELQLFYLQEIMFCTRKKLFRGSLKWHCVEATEANRHHLWSACCCPTAFTGKDWKEGTVKPVGKRCSQLPQHCVCTGSLYQGYEEIVPFSFHIRFSDQRSSQPFLLWAACSVECSFPVYPCMPFYYQAGFFFFKAHSGACLFFLKLYGDLLASFVAGHPVFRQSSCLVKNNHFWMSPYGSCF